MCAAYFRRQIACTCPEYAVACKTEDGKGEQWQRTLVAVIGIWQQQITLALFLFNV